MRTLGLLATFIACLLLPMAPFAKTLHVVADDWPPFSGESLPNKGLSLDLVKNILNRAGYEVRISVVPWARIMHGARTGRYDIVSTVFHSPDLVRYLSYSQAYYKTAIKFLRRRGRNIVYESVSALRPYSIAVGDGFLYFDAFDNADELNKVVTSTTLQGVRLVSHGRVDLTLDSKEVIEYALRHEDPSLQSMVEYLPKTPCVRGLHMAVFKGLQGKDKIIADFNAALREMKADGSYQAIVRRHIARQ